MKELDIKWLQEYAEQEKRYKWGKQIKLLLTAYEKEKGERERIGKLYCEANENCIKYEKMIKKEKEKNKKAIDFINDKNNYFEDGENWQNILKIKHILEEQNNVK